MKIMRTVNIIIFCIWAGLLSLLLYKNYTGAALERHHILNELFYKRTYWYDIYRGTEKIGFAMTSFEQAGDEIIIRHDREVKVIADGREKILIKQLNCLTDLFYSIKSFKYVSHFKDEKGVKVTGSVDDDTIVFFHESPEKRRTKKISLDGIDFYLPLTLMPVLHQEIPALKKPLVIHMLNLINMSINNVKIVLEEIRPIKAGLDIFSLYKFRVGNSVIWSNEEGMIIKEEPPSGITLYFQLKEVAMHPEEMVIFDFTSMPYFKSDTILQDTEELNLLKIRLKGFSPDPEIYEDTFVTAANNVLTIRKKTKQEIKKDTYKMPPSLQEESMIYLHPDEWVLSDYKPLQNTGNIYARSYDYDAYGFTKYLTGYLYGIVRTMPLLTLLNSEFILHSRLGDYIERTILFASYSRAGGLPTRLMGGLVYLKGYFYIHTWPEVWIGGWVPVDPTFVQFPADVTHIPLTTGTAGEIVSVIDDLKDIRIEILEAS
jgi:hypothetical protein